MAHAICHDGYCTSTDREDSKLNFGDKTIIGGLILGMVAILGLSFYGVSLGYYPVPLG